MKNKYLSKIATLESTSLRHAPMHSKIGLGLGITSLGLGLANYHNNSKKNDLALEQKRVEERSLQALNKIHSALVQPPKLPNS